MTTTEYDAVIFIDKDGVEHTKGTLMGVWYEERGIGAREKCGEPLVELKEVEALLNLARDTFKIWRILDGKVVPG